MTPSLVGRIAGAISARRTLSRLLADMGEPPAGILEGLDALRARYRDAIVKHAAPTEPGERETWERA